MPIYVSVDAGGTKCAAVAFDGDIRLVGCGRSGGVNTNFTTLEDCRANVEDCLNQVFTNGYPAEIETLFMTFVGPSDVLVDSLSQHTKVKRVVRFGEGQAGLLSGALLTNGCVAMSGTGSDAFYVTDTPHSAVGGWGSILGDQGSGVWIGQEALRAAIKAHDGWGEPTVLMDYFMADWNLSKPWDLVPTIYKATAPYRKVASALFVVERAANDGDAVTINILREAGELIAAQVTCLIRREHVPEHHRICVCCGGAWKAHPAIYEAFAAVLRATNPDLLIKKPLFEHMLAGVARVILDHYPHMNLDDQVALINRDFSKWSIKW